MSWRRAVVRSRARAKSSAKATSAARPVGTKRTAAASAAGSAHGSHAVTRVIVGPRRDGGTEPRAALTDRLPGTVSRVCNEVTGRGRRNNEGQGLPPHRLRRGVGRLHPLFQVRQDFV